MLRRKKTKIAALLLSLAMAVLAFVPVSPEDVGVYVGSHVWGRFTYHFFHAGFIHLMLNLWCFLSCVFLADVSAGALAAAFVIACSVPALSPVPTVGLSGVCYAMLGFIMLRSPGKLRYNIYIAISLILPTVLLPGSVNNFIHAYCYITAVAVGLAVNVIRHDKRS